VIASGRPRVSLVDAATVVSDPVAYPAFGTHHRTTTRLRRLNPADGCRQAVRCRCPVRSNDSFQILLCVAFWKWGYLDVAGSWRPGSPFRFKRGDFWSVIDTAFSGDRGDAEKSFNRFSPPRDAPAITGPKAQRGFMFRPS